jgi:phosphoribosylformylglycinamidine cyclo-ligase
LSSSSGTPIDYKSAGVDIEAGDAAKRRIKRHVESTFTAGVRGAFGGFGGMFKMPAGRSPLLVSSADSVGTKLKIAIDANRHDTIGHDLVNHCVNDILAQGASPLFFLDYIAFGKLEPNVLEAVVAGAAAGCRENGCSLIGGETAELPGIYTPPDYDFAGFIVGWVEEDEVIGPSRVVEGDTLIGMASSGLHTNGYSLARRILSDRLHLTANDPFPGGDGTVADVLLSVHRSYLSIVRPLLPRIHALAHITGGGLPGNVNRALPESLDAVIDTTRWPVPNVFQVLQRAGNVPRDEMFRTFNMGVGLVVIAPASAADDIVTSAEQAGVPAWAIGRTVRGSGKVILTGE